MDIKEHLTALERIAKGYVEHIDAMAGTFCRECEQDRLYNADIQDRRANERKAEYADKVTSAATEARDKAAPHIEGLREAVTAFVTADTDAGLLQQLQAVKNIGVQLSAREIEIFQHKCSGNYIAMRLLGEITGITTDIPKLEQFEDDINNLNSLFNSIHWYRGPNGELCNLAPASTTWGEETAAGSAIFQNRLANFPKTLNDLEETWAKRMTGPFITTGAYQAKQIGAGII